MSRQRPKPPAPRRSRFTDDDIIALFEAYADAEIGATVATATSDQDDRDCLARINGWARRLGLPERTTMGG